MIKTKSNNPQKLDGKIKKILQEELSLRVQQYQHNQLNQLVVKAQKYRQQLSLIYSTSTSRQYLEQFWNLFFQDVKQQKQQKVKIQVQTLQEGIIEENNQNQLEPINLNSIIFKAVLDRQEKVNTQIEKGNLKIQSFQDIQEKKHKKHLEKLAKQKAQFSQELKQLNTNLSRIKMMNNSEERRLHQSSVSLSSSKDKQFIQFMKKQKLKKQKRNKLLGIQNKKKIQLQKKEKQKQKQLLEQVQKQKIQQKRKKQKQIFQKRIIDKQSRKIHQQKYLDLQNKLFHKQKFQKTLDLQRYQSDHIKKLHQQKKKIYKSYEKSKIDDHENKYKQIRKKINDQRSYRIEQIKKIQKSQTQKSRIRFHSSFSYQLPHQQYEKNKKQAFQIAKQKRNRIITYKEKVKSNFVPEIDQNKKREILNLMEEIQMGKQGYYKKKTLKNGQTVIEQLQIRDPKEVGLNYLQSTKQMVQKMRSRKKQDISFEQQSSQNESVSDLKKPINYLKQLRQKKQKNTSTSFSSPRTTDYFKTKSSSMSFEQKLKKIENISTKLMQKTKQEEMLLKYGKFKTSEEILNQKQIIDRNYIDLLNMKLQIIERDEGDDY